MLLIICMLLNIINIKIKIINITINYFNFYIDILFRKVYYGHNKDGEKMKYKAPSKCPVCGEKLSITKLGCHKCSTSIEGNFVPCEFCSLPEEDLNFLKIFIKCRGSIKDVEKEMGISYPTVRSKLDAVIKSLGFEVSTKDAEKENEAKQAVKNEILDKLSKGELTAKEATEKIKNL